jgi:hypothetical protein
VAKRGLLKNWFSKLDNAYIYRRENECIIVRWRFGGFAFPDTYNLLIISSGKGVKKVPLPPPDADATE